MPHGPSYVQLLKLNGFEHTVRLVPTECSLSQVTPFSDKKHTGSHDYAFSSSVFTDIVTAGPSINIDSVNACERLRFVRLFLSASVLLFLSELVSVSVCLCQGLKKGGGPLPNSICLQICKHAVVNKRCWKPDDNLERVLGFGSPASAARRRQRSPAILRLAGAPTSPP